jgi:hypothetical protein
LTSKLDKFLFLPVKLKLLFFEALLTQYAIWLLLLAVPFRKIPGKFPNPKYPAENPDGNILLQIKQAAGYASALSFWKNKCLIQSLTARRMLIRRSIPSRLTLGVMLNERKKMAPHAWLTSGKIEIVAKSGLYKELFTF